MAKLVVSIASKFLGRSSSGRVSSIKRSHAESSLTTEGHAALRTSRWILGLSTALSTCCAFTVPAAAQLAESQPVPPMEYNVDANGVDLVTGQYYLSVNDVSVGSGEAELSFSRMMRNAGYESSFDTALNVAAGEYDVIIGSARDHFTSASNGLSTKGTGARLSMQASGLYWYTTKDGTRYEFEARFWSSRVRVAQHRASSITYPDGRTLNIAYDINSSPSYHLTRPSAVYSNEGFRLAFRYQADSLSGAESFRWWMTLKSVTASNATTDFCSGPCVGGRTTTYAWTPGMLQETRTDPAGRGLITTFDATGQITAVKPIGASANRVSLTYTAGRVTTLQTPSGSWQYAYSAIDNPASGNATRTTTVTSPTGLQRVATIAVYKNRIIADRIGTSGTTSYEYDSLKRLTKVIAPEGNATVYQYDSRDNLTSATSVAKDGVTSYVTSASYPATCTNPLTCNKPTSTTDKRGFTTDYVYDPTHGQVTSIKRPSPDGSATRPETRLSYGPRQTTYHWAPSTTPNSTFLGPPVYKLNSTSECASGSAPACVGTAQETRTDITYPVSGTMNNPLPASVTTRAGDNSISATTSTGYNGFGEVATVDGVLAGSADTTTYSYDATGALAEARLPDPDGAGALGSRAERIVRDAEGRVTDTQIGHYPNGNTAPAAFVIAQTAKAEYDATTALKVADSLIAGGVTLQKTQYAYDADARLTCTAQRMNAAAFSATANACALGPEGSQGPDRIKKVDYGGAGRIQQVTDGYGSTGASVEALTYTANGKVATLTDGESNRTTYEYDGFDRRMKTRYPVTTKGANASSTTDFEQLTYDAASNVTSRRLRDGQTVSLTYDNLNRVTFYDQPVTNAYWDLAYEYDLLGRLKKATGNGFAVNAFSYDALGRLTVEQNYNATTYHAYDAAGRQTRLTWQDGFYADYDHDVTGNVTAIRENGAASGVGVLATYAYDDLGRRTSVTRGNGTVTSYGYDGLSRLQSLTQNLAGAAQDLTLGFNYNPAGQIVSNTRSNDAYAWTQHYNVDRPYTVNGLNQLTAAGSTSLSYDGRGNLTNSGGSIYGYTVENRLTTGPNGLVLNYEPTGNRLLKLYNGSAGTDTRFAWSGGQMITEFAAPSMQVLRRYVPGPGVDEPIVWYEGAGTGDRRWLHADERGSVVAISNSAGATININSYDEYGIPASGNIGRFGYTGQAWIPELGMWYYKARVYSPTLGRFMQTDPIGYSDGLNWYNYVGSDPVNSSDPTGQCNPDGSGCPPIDITGSRSIPAAAGYGILVGMFDMTYGSYSYPGKLTGLMDDISKGVATPQGERTNAPPAAKLDTKDHTKQLLKRLSELRKAIQNCAGEAASPQCKPLWDEYQAIINSPEITALRKEQMDMTWRYWGYAFGAEFGGLVGGPAAMGTGIAGAVGSETWEAVKDWSSGF